MQRKQLEGTTLSVSPLGLGTVKFGTDISAEGAARQLDAYLAASGNLIDTAHVYGDWVPGVSGRSEIVIGDWLQQSGRRHDVVLSTKGAHPPIEAMHIFRCTPADIEADLDASLRNLRTDYIDLYFLHRDDPGIPVHAILDCLEKAVKQGKIRYYGCSNWSVGRIRQAQAYAKEAGYTGFVCNQPMWSLADINLSAVQDKTLCVMDSETYAYHMETGLGAMAYSSGAHGYFAKRAASRMISDGLNSKYRNPSNERIYEELLRISAQSGVSVNHLSLLYVMSHPFTSIALASFATDSQLQDSVALLTKDYSPDLVKALGGLKQFVYESLSPLNP